MHILLAPDKFKGSLTGAEAAAAMEAGLRDSWLAHERGPLTFERLPMADGGEGTAESIHDALGGEWVPVTVRDPMGRPVKSRYALVEQEGAWVAVFEMSAASGLWMVRPEDRDLPRASTFGTGELLRHALREGGAERVLIGIGGSATNDGGVGLAAALGFRFLDDAGADLEPVPANLDRLARILPPEPPLPGNVPITVACDVRNPLLGERGATRIYGPQKGLRDEAEWTRLEAGLTRLADVCAQTFGHDPRDVPGAGAAGGLGFGLMAFCRATLRPGFDLVAELLRLEEAIGRADLVFTGEGSLDAQTLEGKAPVGVAALARKHGRPVVAIGGRVALEDASAFDAVAALPAGPMTMAESTAQAAELLRSSVRRAAAWMRVGRGL